MLGYPAYPLNRSPPDYLAFLKLKNGTEKRPVQKYNISEIWKSAIVNLKAITIYEWKKAMNRLKNRPKECIRAEEDYFEGRVFHVFVLFRDFLKCYFKTYGTHCV